MKQNAGGSEPLSTDALSPGSPPQVLLLGIGNLLWADEGFGVRCVQMMAATYRFAPNVTLLDGGTQGLYLLDRVREADVLVVFDAIDYGLPAGTLQLVEGDAVPKFMGAKKMSLHQTGFQELLALADLFGDCPRQLLLIGVQPVALDDFGGSLRPEVKARIQPAIQMALDFLAGLGVAPLDRTGFSPDYCDLSHPALELTAYETDRPPPEQACRDGDARLLPRLWNRQGQAEKNAEVD